MIEDTELLRRYVDSRSEEAFAELVRRRIGLVYSVAVRLTRDTHRAEDVTQAVFRDLARKAPSLLKRPVLAGWLYRSAHFAAVDVIRAEESRARREREAQTMRDILGDNGGDERGEWEKIRPVLDQVISELSEKDRDAVLLRFFDGRSFGDIALRLQLTENTARMRVERALDKLHGLLARRGVTSASAALGTLLAHQASAATAPVGLAAAVTSGSLASAGVGGGTVAGMLQLMINSKTAAVLAGVGLAFLCGTTALEMHARRGTETTLALVDGENGRLAASLRQLGERAGAAERDSISLQDALTAARTRQARQREAAAAMMQASLDAEYREANEFMARHPEVKQAFLHKNRAMAAGRYAPLLRALELSSTQTEEFLDLVAQATSLRFVTADGKALGFKFDLTGPQLQTRLRELLGETGFARYQTFKSEGGRITTELAGNLYASSSPLLPNQVTQLMNIIREAFIPPTGRANNPTFIPASYDWDVIMAKARDVLSEDQLHVLAAEEATQRYNQALGLAVLAVRRQSSAAIPHD